MQYNEEYTKTTFELPVSLVDRVKIQCIKSHVTMKNVITKLLIKWVAEQEKGE